MRPACRHILFCLGLSGLLATVGGCTGWSTPEWMHFRTSKKKITHPGVVAPAERRAQYRALAKNIPQTSPGDQQQQSLRLAEELQREDDPAMRAEIIRTLALYPTPAAAAMLQAGTKDSERDVRVACCDAWRKRGGADAARILSEVLLGDTEIDVRLAAARCLGELKDPSTVAALGTALEHPDPAMQYCAARSLHEITGKDFGDNVPAWREYVRGGAPKEISFAERVRRWF